MLVYEKKVKAKMELVFGSEEEKRTVLGQMDLKEEREINKEEDEEESMPSTSNLLAESKEEVIKELPKSM